MTKLLIVYNKIWPYRLKIFELLNQKYELTVSFDDPSYINKTYSFKTLYIPITRIGPLFFHKKSLHKIASEYDAVIGIYNIRWLRLMLMSLIPFRRYSVSYWGIGVTASYENKFDSNSKWDRVRFFFAKKAESLIFYSDYPLEKYIKAGLCKENLFVAHNTTEVSFKESDANKKNNFLFVGTLYPEKGIDILLDAYLDIFKRNNNVPILDIVGDGPELPRIKSFIADNNLEQHILIHGAIYDSKLLSDFYKNAIACISPNQAGLSVLTAMGNATIFVTSEDAITGGEILNIKDRVNGLIFKGGRDALAAKMEWIMNNKNKVMEMSENARAHYVDNRTPEQMTEAIIHAVEHALHVMHHS